MHYVPVGPYNLFWSDLSVTHLIPHKDIGYYQRYYSAQYSVVSLIIL